MQNHALAPARRGRAPDLGDVAWLLGAQGFTAEAAATLALDRSAWTDERTWTFAVDGEPDGDRTRLMHRAARGDLAGVGELLRRGADVHRADSDGKTALAWACESGHLSVACALLDAGADVDAPSVEGTALCRACEGGHEAVACELLRRGAAIDLDGEASALAAASGAGLVALVRDLLARGAAVEGVVAKDMDVYTPPTALCNAAHGGHLDIVRILADHGANVDAAAWRDETPLYAACVRGHVDVAEELLARGAQLFNRFGETVEEMAAREHAPLDPAIVAWLDTEAEHWAAEMDTDDEVADDSGDGEDSDDANDGEM